MHCIKSLLKIGEAAIPALVEATQDNKAHPYACLVLKEIAPAYSALVKGL